MEKEYYYNKGSEQFGPFTIEQLKTENILRETLVWCEGFPNWVKAGEVNELNVLFKKTPPPLPESQNLVTKKNTPPPLFESPKNIEEKNTRHEEVPENKKNVNNAKTSYSTTSKGTNSGKGNTTIIVVVVIIFVVIIGIVAVKVVSDRTRNSNANNYTNEPNNNNYNYSNTTPNYRQKSSAELKQELKMRELNNPRSYLTVSYNLNYNLLSGKDIIRGKIISSATSATFKDVILTVTFSTTTNTVLGREDYVVYQYVQPNSSTDFDIRVHSPSGTKKIGIEVKSASGG